ncbi:MAG: GNAT family N-acetyltransferase [Reinekea sp.]|nr:GNAT family N-acetyltransferase [Reinekea sp.]
MTIEDAKQHHLSAIKALVESLAHYYLEDTMAPLPEWFSNTLTEQSFEDRLNNPDYHNWVYRSGNEVLGYIAMKNDGHLYHLFVAEHAQGRGIARQLWEHVCKLVPQQTYTLRSSLYAVPVYRKFGFIETGAAGFKDGIGFQPMTYTVSG